MSAGRGESIKLLFVLVISGSVVDFDIVSQVPSRRPRRPDLNLRSLRTIRTTSLPGRGEERGGRGYLSLSRPCLSCKSVFENMSTPVFDNSTDLDGISW